MKRILMVFAVMMLSITAFSQSTPNRLLVVDKTGGYKGFMIERLDSIVFRSVEGRVAADVEFLGYEKDNSGASKVRCSVTRTPDCYSFKITCVAKSLADALTTDIAKANYVDRTVSQSYSQNFTNAEMTGFDFDFQANTSYTLLTVGFDGYGVPCEVSRADFATPSANIAGNPSVDWVLDEVTPTSFKLTMTPNSDCSGFYTCQFKAGDAENQYAQWAAFMGFANIGDMIKSFSGYEYNEVHTQEWTALSPSTDYEVYILPLDANGEYGSMVIASVRTAAQGGSGTAEVTITLGEFGGDAEGGYWQRVIYTPNDQTSLFRDMTIVKSVYESEWGDDRIISYLKQDDDMNPYWNHYAEDNVQWTSAPNTEYIAFAIAKNVNGEWGPLARKEYTTPSSASPVAKKQAVGTRLNADVQPSVGVAPVAKAARSLRLVER